MSPRGGTAVGMKIGSTQGGPVPQPGSLLSKIDGRRQSQWPANPSLPKGLTQVFSAPRNCVKAVPSGAVPVALQV